MTGPGDSHIGNGKPLAGASAGTGFVPGIRARRAASVMLSQTGGDSSVEPQDVGSLMDPATQSLSDALRITYKLVQLSVLVLLVLYALSGFRSVAEGERGIRLVFGKVEADDVGPGFRFAPPAPFGELVTVQTGAQTAVIDTDYFCELTEDEKKKVATEGVQFLGGAGRMSLNPEVDGALLTADGNIAHTRWSATYHRAYPARVEQNIDPEFERSIVLGAIRSAIVRAGASVTIDELLKNTPDAGRDPTTFRTVESIAHELAQDALDDLDAGIELDSLSLTAKIPPRIVMSTFNQVQSAESEAQKLIEAARADRSIALVETAGPVADEILRQIDRYEKQIELKQDSDGAATLAAIDGMLLGEPVEVEGRRIQPAVFGKVTQVLGEARRDRTSLVSRMEAEAIRFKAKREAFAKNPMVVISGDWTDAFSTFLSRPSVQTTLLPYPANGGRMVLMLSKDPDLAGEIERQRYQRMADEARKARELQLERQRYEKKLDAVTAPVRGD
jgi:regulator of protease activity HflC (stomatin/prohibitin superfamily)